MLDVTAIELRVQSFAHLRPLWLPGFADGGLFVPRLVSLAAATPVVVRVVVERPQPAVTLLHGTVAWRRLRAGGGVQEAAHAGPMPLRAGTAVTFGSEMRSRLAYLQRLEREPAADLRNGNRYPAQLAGELRVRDDGRALPIRVDDVGTHGARLRLPAKGLAVKDAPVRLWLAVQASGVSSFAPLAGRVSWVDRARGELLGVHLTLSSREDRLHWARLFSRGREEFERNFVSLDHVG